MHEDTALSPWFHFQTGNDRNVVQSVKLDANFELEKNHRFSRASILICWPGTLVTEPSVEEDAVQTNFSKGKQMFPSLRD